MDSNTIGRAGEYRVMSELLLRGHNPALKAIDNGIDLVLENGKTIQVKTVSKLNNGQKAKSYHVCLANAKYKKGKRIDKKNNIKCEVILIRIIPKNEFYIIPSKEVEKKIGISIGRIRSKMEIYKDRWDILE